MPTIVSITAADAPRDTLVTMLSRSRRGRGKASMLTKTPVDGKYFAVIDHEDTAVTFQVALTALSIRHAEVRDLPDQIQATPATASSASGTRTASGYQRAWTGDTRVDAAISNYLVDVLTPRPGTGLFGGMSFGSTRVFN